MSSMPQAEARARRDPKAVAATIAALAARFGNSLSAWLGEVGRFLTCATDDKPFPWRLWPT